ncbi:MAG TPA: NAD-dependent epimerase/dehydratase family protein [Polyangiales bacterium]
MTQQVATQEHIVVVGAGQIGTPVVERLAREGHRVTWLSRSAPRHIPEGARHVSLDVTDPVALAQAAQGARAVIAAVNPSVYDARVWSETLPKLHAGLIAGVARIGARLVLLDALYLYAIDQGPLSPETPQIPATIKGKIRKQASDLVREAQQRGELRATVLRASDFWGPGLSAALLTEAGLAQLKANKRPFLLGDPNQPHAFSHRDDVVDALINLAFADDDVEGRVFHAPVIHVAPRQLVGAVAKALEVSARPFVAPRWLLRLVGLFSPTTGGMVEMLPQWQMPYLVDDSAYRQRFGRRAISLEQGVAALTR